MFITEQKELSDIDLNNAHKRMDKLEKRIELLLQNQAPTVPQYDLQSA